MKYNETHEMQSAFDTYALIYENGEPISEEHRNELRDRLNGRVDATELLNSLCLDRCVKTEDGHSVKRKESLVAPLPNGELAINRPDVKAFLKSMDDDIAKNILLYPDPPPELERTAKIKQCGDRRAIELLFETKLDGNRVNLLLARIYVAAENAEREVMNLGDKAVEEILAKFKSGPAGANGAHP